MIAALFGWWLASARAAEVYALAVPEIGALFSDRADLPGRADVFENFLETHHLAHSLHPPVTEMMRQTYALMGEVELERRAELSATCAAMLADPSEENRSAHNLATANYLLDLGHDVVAQMRPAEDGEPSLHQTQVLPSGDPRKWLTRLARLLGDQPLPVRLVVSTAQISGAHRGVALDRTDTFSPQMLLASLDVLPHHATLPIEHELFHNRQMQGQAVRATDVWPEHFVQSTEAERFTGRAGEYIAHDGYFAIEEIGAFARDAVQATLAIAADEAHRFGDDGDATPAELIAEPRRAARSFADAAGPLYEILWARIRRGELREEDVAWRDEIGAYDVPVTRGTSLLISRDPDAPSKLADVTAGVARARAWIAAYRAFLRPPTR